MLGVIYLKVLFSASPNCQESKEASEASAVEKVEILGGEFSLNAGPSRERRGALVTGAQT